MSAQLLVQLLRDPASAKTIDMEQWIGVIAVARAELLLGTLGNKMKDSALPPPVEAAMADARLNSEYQHRSALWEADSAARALSDFTGKVVLMKGTAYVAAAMVAGVGRHIGDLDIMVPRDKLKEVEDHLLGKGGWEWVKEDAYDDAYYRDHMHELPPLIHKERDRMIDVHHNILPMTAKPTPDAEAMLADALPAPIGKGLSVFAPEDMTIHCAAHLIADGDLTGGLRNLWDFHCLTQEFAGKDGDYWKNLEMRAAKHGLLSDVQRAARLAHNLFRADIPSAWARPSLSDRWFVRRILARDAWGRGKYPVTRFAFYIRSHWMRMPPLMLARHLWTKWRKAN